MTAIATNKFRIRNAQNFVSSISTIPLYAFIGRPQTWLVDSPVGSNVNESLPRTPEDNRETESYTMQGIMQMKKINSSSVIHACKNRKWTSGYNYNPYLSNYDGTVGAKSLTSETLFYPESVAEANYYVVSNGFVYVCLEEGTGTSTVDPNLTCGTGYVPAKGADGYLWKMVAQASNTELSAFETPEFFPVSNDTTNKTYQAAAMTHVVPGAVYSIRVPSGGTGSSWGTTSITGAVANNFINVIGDGTGLEFDLNISSGKIVSVTVTNPGSGYTHAKFALGSAGTGKTLGTLGAVISSKSGLGADVIADLNAYFVIITNLLTGAEGGDFNGFTVNNDYRVIGLVSRPLQWNSSTQCASSHVDGTTILVLDSNVNINPDDTVTIGSGRKAYVVDNGVVGAGDIAGDVFVGQKYLRVIFTQIENTGFGQANDPIAVNDPITNGTANTTIDHIVNPGYEPQSGDLLYYENRRPISRAEDQNEYIRVVIEF